MTTRARVKGLGLRAGGDEDVAAPPASGLRLLFGAFILYLAFGKGFAYAGWPPIFVGEVLLLGVATAALMRSPAVPRHPAAAVAAGLAALAAVQAVVDRLHAAVPLVETIRGLAPVYYSGFAFAAYAVLREFERRAGRVRVSNAIDYSVGRCVPFVLGAVTTLTVAALFFRGSLPSWPGSGGPLISPKSTDRAVALVVIAPFLFVAPGPATWSGMRRVLLVVWTGAALMVSSSRGALIGLLVGLLLFKPNLARLSKALFMALACLMLLYVTGFTFDAGRREMSYDAFVAAAASIGGAETGELSSSYLGTRNWRADWWASIWDDVRSENMLFHGRGWGDNLTVRHGVTSQIPAEEARTLRLPHNLFFSLVGRAGLVAAIGYFVVPVLTVARTFQQRGRPPPVAVQSARGGVVATLTMAMFDVHLESPQGGIVYWILIGFLWWSTATPLHGTEGMLS